MLNMAVKTTKTIIITTDRVRGHGLGLLLCTSEPWLEAQAQVGQHGKLLPPRRAAKEPADSFPEACSVCFPAPAPLWRSGTAAKGPSTLMRRAPRHLQGDSPKLGRGSKARVGAPQN